MFGHAYFGAAYFGQPFFGGGIEEGDGTAEPRTGGAVTAAGGSVGLAAVRAAGTAATSRPAGTPAQPR